MSTFIAGVTASVILIAATIFTLNGVQISTVEKNATKATHVHL